MADENQLSGQVAAVTGAGRGIGRAIALEQARQGAKVALLARSGDEIDAAAEEIAAAGGTARAYAVDITDTAAVADTFARIERDLGPVTLLTNNAGAFAAIGPIWEVDPEAWWRDVETNIRGTFNCCRAVLPSMLARRQGRIINFTGGGTGNSFPNGSGYGTSKAGLLRFTESVSDTLKDTGVMMIAMDPGLVRTSMTEYQLTSAAGRTYLTNIPQLFEEGVNVPPTFAARLSVAVGAARFDRMAGRMLMAARGDQELTDADIAEIVQNDFRSLRINGIPAERRRQLAP
jgi:NAD(P)-dependent dehydrogenase (short-subunit alcohol dehydrogenase family)